MIGQLYIPLADVCEKSPISGIFQRETHQVLLTFFGGMWNVCG